MSHLIGFLLALLSIVVATCKALPDYHKQMSPQQLQSTFHVDTVDDVPHYEVVQLLHHNQLEPATQHKYKRHIKRSVEPLHHLQDHKQTLQTHHVKKDLSKNPYYSALKAESSKFIPTNSVYEGVTEHKKIKNIKEHKVSFKAFGKDVNLTLKQTQGLFKNGHLHRVPMWYVDNQANATHGLNLQKIEDEFNHTSDNVGEVYQDEENMAAVLMRHHEVTGDLVMEGSIGHDLVIKPLPHDLIPNQKESRHVIFKREAEPLEHLSDFAFMEPDDLATSEKLENRYKRSPHRTTLEDIELEEEYLEAEDGIAGDEHAPHQRTKRQAPYIIYPEILVIVDYDGYRLHGGDNLQVKRYFISFWNGVDLRYRLLKGPRIRISIAGIIISRGRDATPYLERNRVGRDAIDSAAALTDMGKYLFRERRLPVYDIAVAITKYDMCRRRKGGRCTKGTAGFAYVGGACVVNKRLEKVNSVAIIEDTGGFSGIIVAAHEVGHLLGAVHDGSPPPSYLGGPGAQRCRWEDGYIMSDLRHTERGFRWSPCTVQSFHHFLNGDTATCLHNAPHEDSALGRSLPGTLLSLDAQCRRDRGTYACFKDERVCAQLFCFDAQTGYCVAYRPAAEGSSCGNGLHCLDGRCTPLISNVIPNYGHQYRLGYKSNKAIESKKGNNSNDDDDSDEDDEGDDDDYDDDDDDDDDDDNDNDDDDDNENEDSSEEETRDGDKSNNDKEEEKGNVHNNNSENQTKISNKNSKERYKEQFFNELFKEHRNEHTDSKELIKIFNNNHIDLHSDKNMDETMLRFKNNQFSLDLFHDQANSTQNSLANLNTYQYLAQLWQNLQTTTTTRTPLTGYRLPPPDKIHIQNNGQNYVVVKTSTNNSMSSSSSQGKRTDFITAKTTTTPNNLIQNQKPHNTITTTTTTISTPTTTPTTSTFIRSLRKQFQYYSKLLQDNNHNSRNNRFLNKKQNYNRQTISSSKHYSNSQHNAAATAAAATSTINDENIHHHEEDETDDDNNNDDSVNVDTESNGGDENDESNETVEKQKRKFSLPLTTKTLQQLQLPVSPKPNPTTAIPITATAALRYGAKSNGRTSLSTPIFFENYFKKFQNPINKPTLGTVSAMDADIPKTFENNKKLKTNENKQHHRDYKDDHEEQEREEREEENENEEKSITTFEAQFLKRTPKPSTNEDAYSSININSPHYKQFNTKFTTMTTATTSHNNSSSSSTNSKNNTTISTPQSPLYVANYIGDNTHQRLTSTARQQLHKYQQDTATTTLQQKQQQLSQLLQHNSHQQFPTTTPKPPPPSPPPPPQSQQFDSFFPIPSSTTRRPKIRTQKLIRRLRTQIK